MAYTVRTLEDVAIWVIVMQKLPARLAAVEIHGLPPKAQFRFWKTDGSRKLVEFHVSLELSRSALEQRIAGALA